MNGCRTCRLRSFLLAAGSLCRRELVRFLRDRSRVVGSIAPPLVFWFLLGSGLGESFRHAGTPGGADYLQYFFPGTVMLVVLFTAIFATISVIEDRHEGFLQSVLAAPIPRSAMVAGKVLGAALLAFLHGLAFLLLAPAAGLSLDLAGWALALSSMFLASAGMAGLGFIIAWKLDSTQGFHAVMNLLLIPMWMLSGALFPSAGAPAWLKALVALNPMTYAVLALQGSLRVGGVHPLAPDAPMGLCLAVMAGFFLLTGAASVVLADRCE